MRGADGRPNREGRMLSPAPMVQLRALVLARDERQALRALGLQGALQLVRSEAGPDTAPLPPAPGAEEAGTWEQALTRVETVRRQLGGATAAEPPTASPIGWLDTGIEEVNRALETVEARIGPLIGQRDRLIEDQARLEDLGRRLAGFQTFNVPLDALHRLSFMHFVAGSLPAERLAEVERALPPDALLVPLQSGDRPIVALLASRARRAQVEEVLRQVDFQAAHLPDVAGVTPAALSERGERERAETAARLADNAEQRQIAAREVGGPLAGIAARCRLELQLLEARQHFPRTQSAALLTGWMPERAVPEARRRLHEATGGRCILEATSPREVPEAAIPILIRLPRVLRPFSLLVSGYGLPRYYELEPTLFVAISYVLMFGMMFADVGHGLILATAGIAAGRLPSLRRYRDAGVPLTFCGASSALFGAVYGSYFGVPALKRLALWHDPLEGNPLELMAVSVGLGIAMVSLGLVLNAINRFRRRAPLSAWTDKFGLAGLWFYWGALAIAAKAHALRAHGFLTAAAVLFLAVPFAVWLLTEPLRHTFRRHGDRADAGLLDSFIEAFAGAFEALLSYLSNTISFVRLAAYAMSHAALLMAAFVVASQLRHLPYAGGALAVLAIVSGNVFALLLEGIVASVQALRLEYYEFFGKFFSGEGQPFRPFRLPATG